MKIYFDSSALVKEFVQEDGSKAVQNFMRAQLANKQSFLFTAVVTKAEVIAAFTAMRRGRALTQPKYDKALQQFTERWKNFFVVDANVPVINASGDIAKGYKIKGCDAFQLASAVIIEANMLVSCDKDLNVAAVAKNITVWNPMETATPPVV